ESTVLFGVPLFLDANWHGESRLTWFQPLFIRYRSEVSKSTSWVIPPLASWWRKREADQATDFVAFPLVWHFGGKKPTTIVFPLVWDFKRGESRTTLILPPLFERWTRPDGVHTAVLNTYVRVGRGKD